MNGIMMQGGPTGSGHSAHGRLQTARGLLGRRPGSVDRSFGQRLSRTAGAPHSGSAVAAALPGTGQGASGKAHRGSGRRRSVTGRRGAGRVTAVQRRKRAAVCSTVVTPVSAWAVGGVKGSRAAGGVSASVPANARAAVDRGATPRTDAGVLIPPGAAAAGLAVDRNAGARKPVPAMLSGAGAAVTAEAGAARVAIRRGAASGGSGTAARQRQTGAEAGLAVGGGGAASGSASASSALRASVVALGDALRPPGAATGARAAVSAAAACSVGAGAGRGTAISRGRLAVRFLRGNTRRFAQTTPTPKEDGGKTVGGAPVWSAMRRVAPAARRVPATAVRRVAALRISRAAPVAAPKIRRATAEGQATAPLAIADTPGMFAGQAIASTQTALQMMRSGFVQPQTVSAEHFTEGTVRLLTSQVKQFGVTGTSTMTVTLVPGNLGRLRFTVAAHKDGVLAVSLQADTLAAQHLLARHAGELRAQLAAQGFRDVTVDVGAGGGTSSGWQGGTFTGHGPASRGAGHGGGARSGAYRHAPVREGFFAEA